MSLVVVVLVGNWQRGSCPRGIIVLHKTFTAESNLGLCCVLGKLVFYSEVGIFSLKQWSAELPLWKTHDINCILLI